MIYVNYDFFLSFFKLFANIFIKNERDREIEMERKEGWAYIGIHPLISTICMDKYSVKSAIPV